MILTIILVIAVVVLLDNKQVKKVKEKSREGLRFDTQPSASEKPREWNPSTHRDEPDIEPDTQSTPSWRR